MPKGPIVTAWEAIPELHQVEKSISFMFPTSTFTSTDAE